MLSTWLLQRVSDLWSDSAGRIFFVTALFYLLTYALYSGYLAKFAGGFSGLPLSLSESAITDFLNLLPATVFTLVNTVIRGWKTALIFLLSRLIGPFVTGVIVALFYGTWFGLRVASSGMFLFWTQFFILSWSIGFVVPSVVSWPKSTLRRRVFIALWLFFQIFGISGLIIVAPTISNVPLSVTSAAPVGVPLTAIAEPFVTVVLLVLFLFIPIAFGMEVAEVAVKQELLSKVSRLVLKQPIAGLGEMVLYRPQSIKQPSNCIQRLLLRSSASEDVEHGVYVCALETPTYFLASFRNSMAFFILDQNSGADGHMTIVASDLIYSIELQSRQRKVATGPDMQP